MLIGTDIIYVVEFPGSGLVEFTWTGKAHITDGIADAFLMENADGIQVVVSLEEFKEHFHEKSAWAASKKN